MGSITSENWLELAKLDPELEAILSKLPEVPKISGDIFQLRKMAAEQRAELAATGPSSAEGVIETDIKIPVRDGFEMPTRIYTPASPPVGGSPLVVLFHGGGFCLGGLENEELNCRNLTQRLGCVCVNIDYRLAPENPFPVSVNDGWDAVKWAAEHAVSDLKADPSKGFIVGGTSAGGNMTAVVGLLGRDEKLSPPLTGLLLCIPSVLSPEVVPEKYRPLYRSYEQNKDAPILNKEGIDMFMSNYKPDVSSWLFNPFNHPNGHAGLPPAYFQVCGMDPLRDEALIYEKVLREDYGVKTLLDVYPGQPHGFWTFFPDMTASGKMVNDTVKGVEWLLKAK